MACWRLFIKGFLYFLTILVFTTFSTGSVMAQNITKRIWVTSGGSVAFNFKSLTEYSSGKTLSNWTRLNIHYRDTSDVGGDGTSIGWKVMVRAGAATIQSDGAAPDLPLSSRQIKPTSTIPGVTITNITLTAADQNIVEGIDPGAAPLRVKLLSPMIVALIPLYLGDSPITTLLI